MRTILITGAGRENGLGYQTAKKLIKLGHKVILSGRDEKALAPLAQGLGANASFIQVDLASPEEIEAFAQKVSKQTQSLDTLINNAGILLDGSANVVQVTREQFEETFSVNTFAPVQLVQELLPLLRRSSNPRIVNVSSGAGQLSDGELGSWAPVYSASKAALNALTQQLASALPEFAVNSVCPGWCHTDMGGAQAPRTPEQGADTIAWLAAEASQNLTGKFLRDRKEIPW